MQKLQPPSTSFKQQVLLENPPMGSKKVCISFMNTTDEIGGREYNIFILDLDSGTRSRIQIDGACIYDAAFCVLGSTLYAFESYHFHYNRFEWKSVFRYELPSSDVFDCKVNKRSMLVEAGRLNDPKRDPKAIVLTDGRILVFSYVIKKLETTQPMTYAHDFEIFDPVEGVCYQLPKFYPTCSNLFYFRSHTLREDKSAVVVRTEYGSYSLKLRPPYMKKQWKPRSIPDVPSFRPHPGISFLVIRKMLCLTPSYAFDLYGIEKSENSFFRGVYEFPHSSSICGRYSIVFGGITTLEGDSDLISILKVGIQKDTRHPLMILDVYKLDLNKCKMELAKVRVKKIKDGKEFEIIPLPGATKIKSLEFLVDDIYSHSLYGDCFSSIRAA